ncbi:MAG: DUF4055 domain-containing protein [Planctomycetes bacterium]|nr:DUF4055 domain-containing protein [Planctomycetota bacterium]
MPPTTDTAPVTSVDVGALALERQDLESAYWQDIVPLRGGSAKMRAAGQRLLPFREREESAQWERRRAAAFLDPYYDDAITQAAARPFAKAVSIRGDLPPELEMIPKDVDRHGTELTVFAHDVYDGGLDFGMWHVFVDFPDLGLEPLSVAEEQLLRARPVFLHVSPPNLRGASFEFLPNGEELMASCRIRDDYLRPTVKSRWTQEKIKRVRVFYAPRPANPNKDALLVYARFRNEEIRYEDFVALGGRPGAVETWEKGPEDKEYVLQHARPFTYPGLPLFTFCTGYRGRLEAQPFFWKIAELNIAHWQFSSVHHSYVDMIQVGGWVRKGAAMGKTEPIEFGHKRVIDLPAEQDLAPLEHEGKAYEAGKDYKRALEQRMKELSTQLFLENRPADITATGDVIRDAKNQSTMQQQVRSLENVLGLCFKAAATWLNVNRPTGASAPIVLDKDFAVDIASDQSLGVFSAQEAEALFRDVDAEHITVETYLGERKRRGGYPDDFDPAEEARKVAVQRRRRLAEAAPEEDEDEEPEEEEAEEKEEAVAA